MIASALQEALFKWDFFVLYQEVPESVIFTCSIPYVILVSSQMLLGNLSTSGFCLRCFLVELTTLAKKSSHQQNILTDKTNMENLIRNSSSKKNINKQASGNNYKVK